MKVGDFEAAIPRPDPVKVKRQREDLLKDALQRVDPRTGTATVIADWVWPLLAEVEAHRSRALAERAATDPWRDALQLVDEKGFVLVSKVEWANALRAMGVPEHLWQQDTKEAEME